MSRSPIFAITIKCTLPVPRKDAASLASAAARMKDIATALADLGLEDITVDDRLTSRPGPAAAPAEPQGATVATGAAAQLSEIRTGGQAAAGMTGATGDGLEPPGFLDRRKGAAG